VVPPLEASKSKKGGKNLQNSKEDKAKIINGLSESFGKSKATFVYDYKGMTVEQVTNLRKQLSEVGATMKVVRNTLALRALSDYKSAKDALSDKLVGTNAVIFAFEEASGAAKTVSNFAKDVELFSFKAGVMGDTVLDANRLKYLSTLPGKDELRAKLLGTLQAPMSQFVRVLNAVPGGFVNVLNAYKDKKSS
jgi:large subunit ribosomal protein L10